jgi:DNA/RNA-binding domain of Phe-tRNA-synthetase-like protein
LPIDGPDEVRQCDKTKLTPATRNAYFISEGFHGVNDTHIEAMSGEFEDTFVRLLGGTCERFVIDGGTPEVDVPLVAVAGGS